MSDDAITKALDVAKKRICICDGECYETRRARMYGLCEGQPHVAAIAIAAFLDALPSALIRWGSDAAGYDPDDKPTLKQLAAAIRRAGGGA